MIDGSFGHAILNMGSFQRTPAESAGISGWLISYRMSVLSSRVRNPCGFSQPRNIVVSRVLFCRNLSHEGCDSGGRPRHAHFRRNSLEAQADDRNWWPPDTLPYCESTMTAGRRKRVAPYIENEEAFFFTYGDGVAEIEITRQLAFHRSHGKLATVTSVMPPRALRCVAA